jgi:hypothetical protein
MPFKDITDAVKIKRTNIAREQSVDCLSVYVTIYYHSALKCSDEALKLY